MKNTTYQRADWDDYAVAHQSVMPSKMLALNLDVAARMHGHTIDLGCGTAKVAPFLLHSDQVRSYTGVDYSPEMVDRARWMLNQFTEKPGEIHIAKIEKFHTDRLFESALSINSYYAWANPEAVLTHIFQLLHPGACFVIATPNPRINMNSLLEEADREMIAHPYYPAFRKMNLNFCSNPEAHFVELDQLVAEIRSAGFKIFEANQEHYLNGVNLVHATRPR